MIDKTENPAEIYLITDNDGDLIWSDTPAPGEGMREEDATRYVREDLYDNLLKGYPDGMTPADVAKMKQANFELCSQVEQQSKVIGHIAAAVGCKDDPLSCWEEVDALRAQVEQLRGGLNQAIELLVTALHEPLQITEPEIHDLRTLEKSTPAQCLAEVRAQAGWSGFVACLSLAENAGIDNVTYHDADVYAEKIRQAVKGGEL